MNQNIILLIIGLGAIVSIALIILKAFGCKHHWDTTNTFDVYRGPYYRCTKVLLKCNKCGTVKSKRI